MCPKVTKLVFQICLSLLSSKKHSSRGYVLFLVMGVMFVLQALLMAYLVLARVEKSTTEASLNSNTSFYGAEGGLNLRSEKLKQKFLSKTIPDTNGSNTPPTSTADCLDGSSTNDGNADLKCSIDSIGGKKIITYINDLNAKDSNTQLPIPRRVTVPPGELFEDLTALEYRYNIFADAQAPDCSSDCTQESKQEMLIKIRSIPLFQFAAFYKDDMEFHPGSQLLLSGPVHSNSNIYFGAQQAYPNNLTINGQVSAVGSVYSRRKSDNTTFSSDRTNLCNSNTTVINSTNCPSLFDGSYTNSLLSALDSTYIKNRWGNRLKVGVKNIKIPAPSFLDTSGDYYKQADIRVEFNPTLANIPFTIQSIDRSSNSTVNLSTGQLQSLRQPVMTNFCASVDAEVTGIPSTIDTPAIKEAIARALKVSIASAPPNQTPLTQSTDLNSTLDSLYGGGSGKLSDVRSKTISALVAAGLTNANATSYWDSNIKVWTAKQIAALRTTSSPNGGCFTVAPLNVSNFYNSREDRMIQVLQLNVAALTAWNKDGVYVEFSGNTVSNNNGGNGFNATQSLFKLYDADNNSANGIQGDSTAANGSLQKLGYAASDRSDGGLVIYANVNSAASNATTNQSPYGFAVSNAGELPGLSTTSTVTDPTGVTIASDQAIYLQGDYNTVNKQPAAILADSINVLSNACAYSEALTRFSCGNGTVGAPTSRTAPDASNTTVNAAFLSGTDISLPSVPNGGLHNYPRLHENWQPSTGIATLTYRGSLVSLGTPQHVNGVWTDNQTWAYINPKRDYNYDIYFDSYQNLPPLTPNLVYLRQEVFSRKFLR